MLDNFSQYIVLKTRHTDKSYRVKKLMQVDKYARLLREESSWIRISRNGTQVDVTVTRKGLGLVQTTRGNFYVYHFYLNDRWKEYTVIVKARLDEQMKPIFDTNRLLLRIDSACTTGQIFGDLTCDCNEQLMSALSALEKNVSGMVIRIDTQDGRGMGTGFKLVTLLMQKELKCSTVKAFNDLAGKLDDRDYFGIVAILKHLGTPRTINLMTNNPLKLKELEENGYSVTMVKMHSHITDKNRLHLASKRKYMGHMINV